MAGLISTYSWGGACSHNPLIEAIIGDFDLSAEQLEARAALVKARRQDPEAKARHAAVARVTIPRRMDGRGSRRPLDVDDARRVGLGQSSMLTL